MKKILILLSVPCMMLIGCKPKSTTPGGTTTPTTPTPKACFTISSALLDSGQTLTTTNCSTNSTSWLWNFGLGTSSNSTASAPTWLYNIGNSKTTSTPYTVKLTAYNSDKSKNATKDTIVYMGFRKIDSVQVVNVPGLTASTSVILQFGPDANISLYSSAAKVFNGTPFTVSYESQNIVITPKNNTQWKGHIFNSATSASIYTFGGGNNVFLSRGLNTTPIIKVTDSNGLELDFYYHLIKQ